MAVKNETKFIKAVNAIGRIDYALKERLPPLEQVPKRLLRKLVHTHEAELTKVNRATDFITNTLYSHPELQDVQFNLRSRPEGVRDQVYLEQVAEAAARRLGELGLSNWAVDMAASIDASTAPNTYGYGNHAIRLWGEDHFLVFRPSALAQVIALRQPEAAYALAA